MSGSNKRNRMVFLGDIIRALSPITRKELISFLGIVQGGALPDLSMDLNLLLRLGLVKKDSGFLRPANSKSGFSYRSHIGLMEEIRIESFRMIRKKDFLRLQLK